MKQLTGRILVVDDDPMSRELLCYHLRRNGHSVEEENNGIDALDHLKREIFDLVLLDIIMPGMGGLETLEQLRSVFSLVDLPVIMVTAKDSSGDVVEAMRLGANDYLTKPLDVPVAMARIQTHLLLRSLKQDLQRERDFSESLIGSAYEMIISVDLDRNITQFNPAAVKSFGYAKEEVLGKNVEMLYDDPVEGQRVYEITLRKHGFTGEVRNRKKSGEVFVSYLSASVLYDKKGNPMGLMGISFDITEQKKLTEKQQEMDRLKEEFLAIASHDLKNPLTGVKGYAVLLRDILSHEPQPNSDAIQYAGRIRSLAEVMEKIIVDFLDFQALEDGQVKLEKTTVQMNNLAETVGQNNMEYARSKSIEIAIQLDAALPEVAMDKDRVSQVIRNFVNNAVKFTPPNGRVFIRTRNESDTIALEVEDTGPGIHAEEMSLLFVKYARLSTQPTGGEKGSGVGLAISRLLIELHGGEIGARNNPEKGMTFWFRLPKAKS